MSNSELKAEDLFVHPIIDFLGSIFKADLLMPLIYLGMVYGIIEMVILAGNGFKVSKYTPLSRLYIEALPTKASIFCYLFWMVLFSSTFVGMIVGTLSYAVPVLLIVALGVVEILIRMLVDFFTWIPAEAYTIGLTAILAGLVMTFFPKSKAVQSTAEGSKKVCRKIGDTYSKVKIIPDGVKGLYSVYKDKFCPIVRK